MALEIITGVSGVFRRDYEVPAAELPSQASGFLNPNASDSLKAGEWLVPNSSGQYIRHANMSTSAELTKAHTTALSAKCVFSVTGDYPNQALGKVTLIQSVDWEGETDMFAGTPAIGDQLGLLADSAGRVVLGATTSADDIVVAICTQASSGGKIRFQAVQPHVQIA